MAVAELPEQICILELRQGKGVVDICQLQTPPVCSQKILGHICNLIISWSVVLDEELSKPILEPRPSFLKRALLHCFFQLVDYVSELEEERPELILVVIGIELIVELDYYVFVGKLALL